MTASYNQLSSLVQEKSLTDQKWCPAKGRDSFLIHDSDISHDSSKFSLGGQTLLLTVFKTAHGGREREKQCINECSPPGAAKRRVNKLAINALCTTSLFLAKHWLCSFF